MGPLSYGSLTGASSDHTKGQRDPQFNTDSIWVLPSSKHFPYPGLKEREREAGLYGVETTEIFRLEDSSVLVDVLRRETSSIP